MRIDHLVWYNANLADGRRYFAECLDEAPLYGGEHPGEGTANAVIALGPSTYLEILGRDVNQGGECLDPEVSGLRGQGIYHWAVGGADLGEVASRAAKSGLESGPLVPGGRVNALNEALQSLHVAPQSLNVLLVQGELLLLRHVKLKARQ